MPDKRKRVRLNLEDALSRKVFHNAILTTYTFEPLFFEDYCIEKFASFASNNNISVILDRYTYEGIVSAPDAHQPKLANIRYLVHPVTVPRRFHSKIFLLTTKTSGRLIFGSANLTRPGLTSNAEIVDQYDFEEGENEQFRYLFCDAFAFLKMIGERWPSESLASNIQEFYRATPWLHKPTPAGPKPMRFLHNLDRSLWSQLREVVVGPVSKVHIVSRFFDDQPALVDRMFQDWNPSKLFIYTENGRTTLSQSWLEHPFVKSGRAEVLFCTYRDEGYQQPLHAKIMVFESSRTCSVVYGSANFTAAALLSEAQNGNVETLIVLPPLTSKADNLKRFIDPCGSAHHLKSDDALQTDARHPLDTYDDSRPVRLRDAVLEHDLLTLNGEFPADFPSSTTAAHLELGGSEDQNLKTVRESAGRCSARIPEHLLPLLRQKSSRVCIKDLATGKGVSNKLLITNLVDIETHEGLRQERHFREARESASQFFAVLNDMLRAGDNAALLTFLSFCDIPLLYAPRLTTFHQRPVWEGREGMRSFGERNLQICKSLHEATLRFFDRHMRKLERHAQTRLLDGIPNFLHIFLAMGNLLRTQIERSLLGLEAKSSPVTVDDWAECRQFWDTYYARFSTLMRCLWDAYLKPISSENKRNDIEREFGPDLDAVHELCDEMIRFRERISQVRVDKHILNYGYFHSVVGAERWSRFASAVLRRQREVEFAVLGKREHQPMLAAP